MDAAIVVTVISEDHPGIVKALSEILTRHSGNWADSSMLSMSGQFAGILMARIPGAGADACIAELKALESDGMQISVKRCDGRTAPSEMGEFSLELVGQDHPGIVHDITRVLAAHEVNVEELETHCESASMSGETLFFAHAKLRIPTSLPTAQLQDELEKLANELMVDIHFEG